MVKTWGRVLTEDPYFNPNLSLDTETFDLAFPPRRVKPWRSGRGRSDAIGKKGSIAEAGASREIGADKKRTRPIT